MLKPTQSDVRDVIELSGRRNVHAYRNCHDLLGECATKTLVRFKSTRSCLARAKLRI